MTKKPEAVASMKAPERTNGLAVASLVLGIVGACGVGSVLAIIFGHVARRQIRDSSGSERGSGMALAGLILGYTVLGLLITAAVFVLIARATDSNEGSGTAPTQRVDTTTSTTLASGGGAAAGKPCVAVSDPLPPGAPSVPVVVGPPPTELASRDLAVGTGAIVAKGATVSVDYIGVACSTGAIFDSSYSGGEPVTFPLANVIPGWTDGIPGMRVGGVRLLGIPPGQAYGDQGQGPDIAPGETLWFVVKVEDTR